MFSDEKELTEKINQLIYDLNPKSIALSGGSTPIALYKSLSKNANFPIDKIDFFQVDERYVAPTNKHSNRKLIQSTLFKFHRPKSFTFIDTKVPISESLQTYSKQLKSYFRKRKKTFDLTILGMGIDGHIASLFPNCAAIDHSELLVAHTMTSENTIKDRITLTFPPIMKSKNILILIKGIEKLKALEQLTSGKKNYHSFPAKKLLSHKKLCIAYQVD